MPSLRCISFISGLKKFVSTLESDSFECCQSITWYISLDIFIQKSYGKSEGKERLGRPRRRWETDIRIDVTERTRRLD